MAWVFLAIGSHFFWGLTNIFEKIIVDKKVKNPLVYITYAFFFSWLGVFLLPLTDWVIYDILTIFWIAVASLGFFLGSIFYIKALKLEEVSRINILWNLIPIFSFFGAWVFIGEKLFLHELVAFGFLMLGGFIASLHAQKSSRLRLSRAFFIMVIACAFFAVYDIVLRYLTLQGHNFLSLSIWGSCFLTLYAVIMFFSKNFRKEFLSEKILFEKKFFFFILFLALISKIGTILNTWAISLGPIALVNAMEGFQALFVFIIAILFTWFLPKWIKEEVDRKNLSLKLTSFILLVAGILILFLG